VTSPYVALGIALVILAMPFILVFFIVKAVREKRKRLSLEQAIHDLETKFMDSQSMAESASSAARAKLMDTRTAAERAVALGRSLEAEKQALTARLKGMEERFKPVCQSARNVDPLSASNLHPPVGDQRLACPALAGVAEGRPSAGNGYLRL